MTRYQSDEYDLERSHELQRQLERDEEREPYWMHPRRRPRSRRPRYVSGLLFRPVTTDTNTTEVVEVPDERAA
jgi:hypothetical protein